MKLVWLALFAFPLRLAVAGPPPTNDTCLMAEVVPTTGPFPYYTSVTSDVSGATTNGDPPAPSCATDTPTRSIWYRFTPPSTRLYTLSVSTDTATTVVDTVMGLYTSGGGCGGPFTDVACSDDAGGLQSAISMTLTGGTTYYIVVWVSGASAPLQGNTAVQLRVSQPAPPANDTCVGAEVIPGGGPFPYLTAVTDNTLASTNGDPPMPLCPVKGSRSVWYRFAPEVTAAHYLSLCSDTGTTVYDTLLAVYSSANGCGGPFTPVACNEYADPLHGEYCSAITTQLTAGVTYYIVAWESGTDPYTPGETSIQLLVSRFQSPVVMTLPASNITSTSMILRGLANPSGAATAAWFEWGTTTNYGNSTGGQSLGGGSSNLLITAPLSGLSATNYHFHLKATNSVGFSIGLDRTAIWSAAPPWFSSISSVGNGSWQLRFTGVTAQLYLLQASSNLADWAQIGTALDLGNGLFQYQDSSASSLPARFYRVLAL